MTSLKKYILLLFTFLINDFLFAQRVYPLISGITVDSILQIKSGATKLAKDPISGHLFYQTGNGNIYEVFIPTSGIATDTLRFTSADHHITAAQGLYFRDSTMYICGNIWSSTTGIGKIVKGKLQANGTRVWINVVTTNPYPTADPTGDHGFSAVTLDPKGNYIYVSSGARTHLGEIRTNGGTWPGYREVPLTTRIFKFPVNTVGLMLPNDSTLIDNSGYVYAWGTRNAYDMGWDGNDTLFAIDNSGERDDPDELNWLRKGKNYGYPWRMGGNVNPLTHWPYNVNADPLVNHQSAGYLNGWFANDSTFPAAPAGVTFSEPIRNYGVAADFFRDSITGKVKEASATGTYITSVTAHRSPLGLVFDRDSMLASPFRGSAFLLSFMPGGDSTGYTPISPWGSPCPFVDPVRDLLQLQLTYNATIDNYVMTTSRILAGFYLPVDAELINNTLYVIENAGNIWKINFPAYTGINTIKNITTASVYPNPFSQTTTVAFENPNHHNYVLTLYNMFGQIIQTIPNITTNKVIVEKENLSAGFYIFQLSTQNKIQAVGKLIVE
jgi:glucose/arabinose dehydrogenase